MLKNLIKYVLQKLIGLKTYLFLFSVFMIVKLKWDKREGAFLNFLKLIKSNGAVIDIGANIGVMTYHFSKKLPESVVYSFEPIAVNFHVLEKIKRRFNLQNVKVFNYALGNKKGELEMIMPKISGVYFHGLSHIASNEQETTGKKFTVLVMRLDDLEIINQTPVEAIKIDVENYEYEVLLGAENVIKKNRPLIYCELWPGKNRDQCFAFFKKNNYHTFVWYQKKLTLFENQVNQNFFFIPSERTEKLIIN